MCPDYLPHKYVRIQQKDHRDRVEILEFSDLIVKRHKALQHCLVEGQPWANQIIIIHII